MIRGNRFYAVLCVATVTCLPAIGFAQGLPLERLPGVVVDNEAAEVTGEWKDSTHTRPFAAKGYIHDDNKGKGEKSVRFQAKLPKDGEYDVRLLFSTGGNRASNVPVTVEHAGGKKTITVNQKESPKSGFFLSLGKFRFEKDKPAVVTISNEGTDGYVIADAVQFVDPQTPTLAKLKVDKDKPAQQDKEDVAAEPMRVKKPRPAPVYTLTPAKLDALVAKELEDAKTAPLISDEKFLRRASLDLIGRQPTSAELDAFLSDSSSDRRARAVDRLLENEAFGKNWANYWSDTIAHRVPPPELTFLDYTSFKGFLAERFNANTAWDEIVYEVLTAQGKVGENPAATFVGFHQGESIRLAGETTRIFLSVKIACAQCHDDPFQDWKQEQFHHMAAFFARTNAKLPWNNSDGIEVKDKGKGEHRMPASKKKEMVPMSLTGMEFELGTSDLARRRALADWVTSRDNEWFAKSFVNRVWSRLMGRGFCEPVDNIYSSAVAMPPVFKELAKHFTLANYDIKNLFRLIVLSETYQRALPTSESMQQVDFAAARPQKLRGDEVFDSLVAALKLPNVQPKQKKPDGNFRFPPPPKSTRDLVNTAFGYDPSLDKSEIERTMQQAMWLMNNEQLQKQINADPESGTVLAQLLAAEKNDEAAVVQLFRTVLARTPSDKELKLSLQHVKKLDDRGKAFEDLLWSLVNTTEFTTRR